jgi:DNA-binding transcriptional LysR family regulator
MRRLPDFEAWAIFAKVAQLGSFARAAEDLALSKPTVSKAVGRLEASLGFSLLNRTSRRLSLTEAGRASMERAMRILNEGHAAEDDALVQSTVPRGRVRVSAPLSFGVAHLGAVLPEFLTAYPEITLDLALSDRRVDVVAEGFDLAIRIASLEASSLMTRRLCDVRILLVGASAYFERRGRPTHPGELGQHSAMVYTGSPTGALWRFSHAVLGETSVEPRVCLWTDNADMLTPSLVAGHGLALQPEFLVWKEIRDGALEIAMPEWTAPSLGLHLLMPPSSLRPLRVRVLVDYLARSLARTDWGARGS